MPDVSANWKVPRPLGSDPVEAGDDLMRSLAAYLDGLAWANVGALSAGWSGTLRVARFGPVVSLDVQVTKTSYSAADIITSTSPGVFLPAGCIPANNLSDGRIVVLASGRIQTAVAGAGALSAILTYLAPAP